MGKSTRSAAWHGCPGPWWNVEVAGAEPGRLKRRQATGLVGMVPADSGDLLLHDRVDPECTAADREADATSGTPADLPRRPGPRD